MAEFDPDDWPRFILVRGFDHHWAALGLDDRALVLLQGVIAANPAAGPVMRGSGGLRKIRFVAPGEGRGKSGAYRVGYLAFPDHGTMVLVTVWGKNEKANLSAGHLKGIAALAKHLQSLLERGGT